MSFLSFDTLPPWAMAAQPRRASRRRDRARRALFPRRLVERPPVRARAAASATAIALMLGRFVAPRRLCWRWRAWRARCRCWLMALGVLIARPLVMRRRAGGRAMNSPLASVALFHLGPVPITESVVATWAIMAVLVVGGIARDPPAVARPVARPRPSSN